MGSDEVAHLLQRTANTTIRPRFRLLRSEEVFKKGVDDIVTVADHEAEGEITKSLRLMYPHALILGEEATQTDRTLLERFRHAEHSFTVDPVDGTRNFVNGNSDYAVMVAELRRGETIRSWIFQPEHGLMFAAEKGAGATCNEQVIQPRSVSDDPRTWKGSAMQSQLRARRFGRLQMLRSIRNCAGVDYGLVALGMVDFVIFAHAHPWDHAPGALLVAESGGATLFEGGRRYRPTCLGSRVLSARSSRIARYVERELRCSAGRSRSAGWSSVPAVGQPRFGEESAGHDDGVR